MEKIKTQAGKLGELIFAADTGATYKKTVTLTWAILRETGVLLWLVVCLIFVGVEGFWQKSIALGQATRGWYEGMKTPSEADPKSATEVGQSALSALSLGTQTVFYQAKKQLGMEAEPPAPKPQPPQTPAAAPSPDPAPVKPTESAIAAVAAQSQTEPEAPATSEGADSKEPIDAQDKTMDDDA